MSNCIACDCYIDKKNINGICRKCRRCIDCGGWISTNSKKGRCRECLSKNIFGPNNPNWKEDGLCYVAIHRWIKKYHGKPIKCQGEQCFNKNPHHYEWANISGEYKKDINDWLQLCPSCHKKMDYRKKHENCCKRGHKFTEKNTYTRTNRPGTRECRECKRKDIK